LSEDDERVRNERVRNADGEGEDELSLNYHDE
jgi:hypothetical protein